MMNGHLSLPVYHLFSENEAIGCTALTVYRMDEDCSTCTDHDEGNKWVQWLRNTIDLLIGSLGAFFPISSSCIAFLSGRAGFRL